MIPQPRREGLLVQELGQEIIIYDQRRNLCHSLNPTAALVWRHCDGQTTITEIAALLAQENDSPQGEELVWLAVKQLEKAGLLREPIRRTTEDVKISRRNLLRKIGLAGGVTLFLPVISSIVAPRPATAQEPGRSEPPSPGPTKTPRPSTPCNDAFQECCAHCPDEYAANIQCVTFDCLPRLLECLKNA
jgi:hypothetical protein